MNGVNYLVESCVESFITDLYSDPEVVALEEFYIKTAKRIGAKKMLTEFVSTIKKLGIEIPNFNDKEELKKFQNKLLFKNAATAVIAASIAGPAAGYGMNKIITSVNGSCIAYWDNMPFGKSINNWKTIYVPVYNHDKSKTKIFSYHLATVAKCYEENTINEEKVRSKIEKALKYSKT